MSDWIPIDEATLVCEMSNKRKAQTKLPMNIWIDENQTYIKGHHSKPPCWPLQYFLSGLELCICFAL